MTDSAGLVKREADLARSAADERRFTRDAAHPLLRLRGVTKVYDMGEAAVRALNGIDLEIRHGEYLGIMGPSGSGKTTLMDIIGCLSRPTAGIYEFAGRRVDEIDDVGLASLRGERIGFVFQTFNLLPRLTAPAASVKTSRRRTSGGSCTSR